MKTHSCKHCRKILLKAPDFHRDYEEVKEVYSTATDLSVKDVRQGISDRCELFLGFVSTSRATSLQSIVRWYVAPAIGFNSSRAIVLHQAWRFHWSTRSWSLKLWLQPQGAPSSRVFPWKDANIQRVLYDMHGDGTWAQYRHLNDERYHFPGRRAMNLDPDSLDTYQLAKKWIRECTETHEHDIDRSQRKAILPLRLLHITKAETYRIILVRTESFKEERDPAYLTLSYCWGGVQEHKLTKSQLAHGGVSDLQYDLMPRTIQDAIHVTARLGYTYLWIDSLCIVQDDETEFHKEIAKMPDIYSGAVATIAATSAQTAKQGFLHSRFEESEAITGLSLQYPDNTSREVGLLSSSGTKETDINPLDSRAWALQEHVLSTRVLQYRYGQLQFLCRSTSSRASTYPGQTDGWDNAQSSRELGDKLPVPLFPSHFESAEECEKLWELIRDNYSLRDITENSDKVPAISGVASRLAPFIVGKQYVAGHWLDSRSLDLIWYVNDHALSTNLGFYREYNQAYGDPDWFAPTWAWTSVPRGARPYLKSSSINLENTTCFWKVKSTDKLLVEETAPFGAVYAAVLDITGLIPRIEVQILGKKGSISYALKWTASAPPSWLSGFELYMDCSHSSQGFSRALLDMPVHILPAFKIHDSYRHRMFGLVIVELPDQEGYPVRRYERHGMFRWNIRHIDDPAAMEWLNTFPLVSVEIQ
ncbi:unnamed protein product [Periconia digitata]|uniref:Heterokaryon incompatibility domain-containing protein n=1 Tax=Periconia digitata TaxID=1303443 RepID=A0A9W4UUD8_9PLEO|nr:unnamed protein product [Periconia digitata]